MNKNFDNNLIQIFQPSDAIAHKQMDEKFLLYCMFSNVPSDKGEKKKSEKSACKSSRNELQLNLKSKMANTITKET